MVVDGQMVEWRAAPYRNVMVAWMLGIQRRAAAVAALFVAVTLGLGWFAATHLRFDPVTEGRRSGVPLIVAVESANPDLAPKAAARLAEALRGRAEIFEKVLYSRGETFFKTHALLYLDIPTLTALSERLSAAEPVMAPLWRDPSLRGLQEMLASAPSSGSGFDFAETLADMAEVAEAQLRDRPAVLSWQRLLGGPAVGGPAREIITVQPQGHDAEAGREAIQTIAGTVRQLGLNRDADLRLRLTGSAVLEQEAHASIDEGAALIGTGSAALALLLVGWGLRSLRLTAAVALAVIAGLSWTAAFAAAFAERLTLTSIVFAMISIALGVAFALHLALHYEEGRARGEELDDAAAFCGPAVTLAALAAAIGLLSFLPAPFPPLARLGLISAVGAIAAWVATLAFLPAIVALLPVPRLPRPVHPPLPHVLVSTRRAVAGLLFVAALAALPRVRIDSDPLNFGGPPSEAVATLRDLASDPWVSPYAVTARTPGLAEAEALAERLRRLEPVAKVVTLADSVPRDQAAKLRIVSDLAQRLAPSFAGPPATPLSNVEKQKAVAALRHDLEQLSNQAASGPLRDAAARFLAALGEIVEGGPEAVSELQTRLLGSLPERLTALREALEAGPVTIADLPPDVVARATTPDGEARIQILPRGDMRDPKSLRRFVAAVRSVTPAVTGPPVAIADAARAARISLLEAGGLALVLTALLLRAGLGGWRAAAFGLIPPVLAVLLTLAFTTLGGGAALTLASVGVLPLAAAFTLANRASSPRAVLFSGLAVIGVAAPLTLSAHPGLAGLGILLIAATVLSLVSTALVRRPD